MMQSRKGEGDRAGRPRIPDKMWLLLSFLAAMALWYVLSVLPATARCFPNVVETMK